MILQKTGLRETCFCYFLLIFHSVFIFYSHSLVNIKAVQEQMLLMHSLNKGNKFFHNSLRCTRRRGHSSFSGKFYFSIPILDCCPSSKGCSIFFMQET